MMTGMSGIDANESGSRLKAAGAIGASAAHIDGCSYHGQAGVDFAHMLVEGHGRVQVPTTLNVSSLDLLHPDLYKGDSAVAESATALMNLYVTPRPAVGVP